MVMVRMIGALAVLGLLAIVGQPAAHAQAPNQAFSLEPGGTAVVQFEAFCIEFGEEFPTGGIQAPNGVVAGNVQSALEYARRQNLTADEQQALQVQYAIWQLLGATGAPQGDQLAQDVLAQAAAAPQAPQGATSVIDAAQAGQVQVTIDQWQPVGNQVQITPSATDNFYGRGQLTVRNTSQQTLNLYMPVGTIFPAADQQFQNVAGYATSVQVNNPQQQAQQAQQAQQGGQSQGQAGGGQVQQGGQSQASNRLPTTAVGDSAPVALLYFGGVALIFLGYLVQRRR